jgi:hypothetical protein
MRCPSTSALISCAASLAICLTHAGCSFTFIETVPDNPEQLRYFDCTSTPGLPVADGVIALSNGVAGVSALTKSKKEYADKNDGANRNIVAGISLGVAVIGIASGIYGLVQTERCRTAKAELRDRLIPPAEREQKRLLAPPTPAPTSPPPPPQGPAAVMPGEPTSVEPMPSTPAPAGVPQPSATTGAPAATEPAPATPPLATTQPPSTTPPPSAAVKPEPPPAQLKRRPDVPPPSAAPVTPAPAAPR